MAHANPGWGGLVGLALLVGCSETATPTSPPPIAGFWHPAAVRPGQVLVFDASTSAVAKAPDSDPGRGGTRIVQFRFEVATFPAVEQQQPQLSWTFASPGHYAVRLVVQDDLGRVSEATSAVDVVADLAESCTGSAVDTCSTGICTASQCAALVCAGAEACPTLVAGQALGCSRGACVPVGAVNDAPGLVTGDDVGEVPGVDALP